MKLITTESDVRRKLPELATGPDLHCRAAQKLKETGEPTLEISNRDQKPDEDQLRAVDTPTHQIEMNARAEAIDGIGGVVRAFCWPILRPSTSRFWALIKRLRRFCNAIFIYQLPTPMPRGTVELYKKMLLHVLKYFLL